jgi:hypothetical protein
LSNSVYPSVYVAFHAIAATDFCGIVGTAIDTTTIGFDQSHLSSAKSYFYNSTQYPYLYTEVIETVYSAFNYTKE